MRVGSVRIKMNKDTSYRSASRDSFDYLPETKHPSRHWLLSSRLLQRRWSRLLLDSILERGTQRYDQSFDRSSIVEALTEYENHGLVALMAPVPGAYHQEVPRGTPSKAPANQSSPGLRPSAPCSAART